MIFLFVLAVGAFVSVTMRTEAIQTGIGRLALRYKHSGSMLVIVLMSIFALGGTTYGMWEETLGFFALLVPLVLALNYDRSSRFRSSSSAPERGARPPSTRSRQVASDAAGIEVGDGIALRVIMFIVLVGMAIGYVSGTAAGSPPTPPIRSSASRRPTPPRPATWSRKCRR